MNTLNIEQVRRLAPAAFSISPDSSLSGSYAHVTTASVIDALQQDGWLITSARQSRSRSSDGTAHAKHQISFMHPELPQHAEGTPQMHFGNSGNGTSAARQLGGLLRGACLNQIYAGIKVVGGVFHHRGAGLEDRVVAGARDLRKNFDKIISKVDLWRAIELSPDQQIEFARVAVAARWPTGGPVFADFVGRNSVLEPRRVEDMKNDLWTVFNRVQESMLRGGFDARFRVVDESGNEAGLTNRRVRRVTGIAATERINTELWELAESVAAGQNALITA
jgi:hypothetical protein